MAESRHVSAANCCITQSETIPITFKWIIRNLHLHMKNVGLKISSSTFCSNDSRDKSKWHLELYPKGNKEEYKDHFSLFLALEEDSQETTVTFQFSLLSSKAEKSFDGQKSVRKFSPSESWGWSKFIAVNELLDEKKELVKNDTLTIYCEINVSTDSTTKLENISIKELPKDRLGDDLSKLLENELLCDVILMACGTQYKVHRAILAARSPVFAAMFLTDMAEKLKDVVEIGDISDDVLRNLLHFIYSGKAPEDTSVELISDLLVAADKYDIEMLKVMCENILMPQLTIENAVELLIVAGLHNAEELKAMAMNFVNTHIAKVKKEVNWKSLVEYQPSLLDELFSYHLQHSLKVKDV